jgi:hypothetical protein
MFFSYLNTDIESTAGNYVASNERMAGYRRTHMQTAQKDSVLRPVKNTEIYKSV